MKKVITPFAILLVFGMLFCSVIFFTIGIPSVFKHKKITNEDFILLSKYKYYLRVMQKGDFNHEKVIAIINCKNGFLKELYLKDSEEGQWEYGMRDGNYKCCTFNLNNLCLEADQKECSIEILNGDFGELHSRGQRTMFHILFRREKEVVFSIAE